MDTARFTRRSPTRWDIEPTGNMRVPGVIYASAKLISEMDDEGVALAALEALEPEAHAEHWQRNLAILTAAYGYLGVDPAVATICPYSFIFGSFCYIVPIFIHIYPGTGNNASGMAFVLCYTTTF